MITDILLDWNHLTATMVIWVGVVTLVVGADFAPEIYREHKARHTMANITIKMIAARKAAEQEAGEKCIPFDPNATFQLGVYKIQPAPARRRHARV